MNGHPDLGQALHPSADTAELRDRMADFAVAHDVEPLAGQLAGVMTGVRLGEVKLAFVKYGAPAKVVAAPTAEQVCWTIPVGPMQVGAGVRRSLREGFLLDPENPTVMIPSPMLGAVVVTTTTTALRSQLATLLGHDAPALHLVPGPSRAASKGQVEMAWRYVAASLSRCPVPPDALRTSLAQTLLTALLLELPQASELMRDDQRGSTPSRRHAERAEQWAAEHFTKQVSVSDWARGVSVSVRHLQSIMQHEFGCTPKEYLQMLRLERAHTLLQQATPERTITSIASAAGFTHLGRFAASYREHYGINPTTARAQARR